MPHNHYNYPPYNHINRREAWVMLAACVAYIAVVTAAVVFVRIWMTS